eukprot:m.185087 g.185087  ORF g.185087 m.185087 type:complete len:744 (+) comp14725_c2_seq11:101-2332(+)
MPVRYRGTQRRSPYRTQWVLFLLFLVASAGFLTYYLLSSFSPEDIEREVLAIKRKIMPKRVIELRPDDLSIPDTAVPVGFIPIEVGTLQGMNTEVTLCMLSYGLYSEEPDKYPMMKDLIAGTCHGQTITRTLSQLDVQITNTLTPTGFVFHESRVGSTLVANLLASDPENLVLSESHPPSSILKCSQCSPSLQVEMLRVVMKAMSNTNHKRVFFKFQSVNSLKLSIIKQAFPDTPWVFLYRDPVEVMVSNLFPRQQKYLSKSAPCLRYMGHPMVQHLELLQGTSYSSLSFEEACALHLAALSKNALEQTKDTPIGVPINYKALPDILYTDVFPRMFSYTPSTETLNKMKSIQTQYSKGRDNQNTFTSDVQSKQEKATTAIKTAASKVEPFFNGLEEQFRRFKQSTQSVAARPTRNPLANKFSKLPPDTRYSKEASIKEYLPYPKLQPLEKFLKEWPPDKPDVPSIPGIREGTLRRFDYSNTTERAMAARYQMHEVPFVITNVPDVDNAAKNWANDEYLKQKFGSTKLSVTTSKSNHFYYFNKRGLQADNYEAPTGIEKMLFGDWLQHAYQSDTSSVDSPHYYLQLNSVGPNAWIVDDLPCFKPERSFFIVEPHQNRGINCRFGARGIIASAHYDGGRNFIAMIRGAKRYVILPPEECVNTYMYPRNHPESRHSKAEWSSLNFDEFPWLRNAQTAQVVLSAGEILYLPSYWIHYIISTGVSAQCNTRSGLAIRGRQHIADCGFY